MHGPAGRFSYDSQADRRPVLKSVNATYMSWSFAFLGHSRPQQVINEQQMPGRAETAAPGQPAAVADAPTAPR